MDKQPSFDRGLMIPIAISVFSIVGIFTALSIVYLDRPQTPAPPTRTATPFKYRLLATETRTPNPESATPPPEEIATAEPEQELLAFPTVAPSGVNTLTNSILQLPTATSTAAAILLNQRDRYDNVDSRLEYDGEWVNETNVANTYQGTLSVSNEPGNDLILTFVGQQVIIGYLGAADLGWLSISIDDSEFELNQSTGREWASPQLDDTEHFLIIIHASGDKVNLDYIDILSVD